jgi:hypothetical protein
MGFYDFMETFFFVSLGITFVLILLLVYHFKQRIFTLEQKTDTMFEIINNIVKELSNLKFSFVQQFQYANEKDEPSFRENIRYTTYEQESQAPDVKKIDSHSIDVETIQFLQSKYEEQEDDASSDSTYTYEEEEDEEDESHSIPTKIIIHPQDEWSQSAPRETNFTGEADMVMVHDKFEAIKQIKLHADYVVQSTESNWNPLEEITLPHLPESELEPNEVEQQDSYVALQNLTPVLRSAPCSVKDNNETVGTTDSPFVKESKEFYKKLTASELKRIIISKGVATDVSKLKKNELIKLLEAAE